MDSETLPTSTNSSDDGRIIINEVRNGTPPFTYSWSNGTMSNIAENLGAGNYTVTVTDANGCEREKEFVVDFSTATEDILARQLKIYPTLATEEVRIEYPNTLLITTVELYSARGERLQVFTTSKIISVAELARGVYILKINTKNRSISKRFVKY